MDGPYAQADLIDAYALRVKLAGQAALIELGGRIQDDLQTRLSVAYPPASEPGEYPHRRTGQLAAGIVPSVQTVDGGMELSVESVRKGGDSNVVVWLNTGTQKMAPRPYAKLTRDAWLPESPAIIVEVIQSQLG